LGENSPEYQLFPQAEIEIGEIQLQVAAVQHIEFIQGN